MFNNSSPHWKDPRARRAEQPKPNAELLTALEQQADISEPMRAALSHALDTPPPTPPPARTPVNDPRDRYTLHLTFPAGSLDTARAKAIAYAEGLAALRPEVGASTPLLSPADTWQQPEPLFCGDLSPGGKVCIATTGHTGPHHTAGVRAHHWGHDA